METVAPSASSLREFLSATLPHYMVPSTFVKISALPFNSNGKLDRERASRSGRRNRIEDAGYRAPGTPTEEALVEILARLLGVDRVGADDNFFLLGISLAAGNSGGRPGLRALRHSTRPSASVRSQNGGAPGRRGGSPADRKVQLDERSKKLLVTWPANSGEVQWMLTSVLCQLIEPDVMASPYRLYRELREADPVYWDPFLHAWVVTRYADIVTVLTRLSADRTLTPEQVGRHGTRRP